MNDILQFEISDYQFQKLLDEETALLKVRVCSSGMNLHKLPFDKECLIDAAESSLRGKAIVAKFDKWTGDFKGHDKLESPIGFFIDNQEFEYIDNPDGSCSLFGYVILWSRYSKEAYNVFVDDKEHKRPVSMEIKIIEWAKGWDDAKVGGRLFYKYGVSQSRYTAQYIRKEHVCDYGLIGKPKHTL